MPAEARMGASDANDWLSRTPLIVLALAVPALMTIAILVGAAVSVASSGRRAGSPAAGARLEGAMTQAVLGLLALLMAFTFALAIDRFDTRRHLVLEEANAIGTTYLPKESAKPGVKIEIEIRSKKVAAEVVKMPFVPHRTKK